MKRICPLTMSAIVGLIAFSALADTVKLRDDTELSGRIVKRTDDLVTIDMDGLALDVKMEQIDSINGEKIVCPKDEKATEMKKAAKDKKTDKDTAAILERLKTKPSVKQILANAKAKSEVIRNPDPEKVLNISDETFFAAIDPNWPGMKSIVKSAKAKNFDAAWKALDTCLRKNLKPVGALRDVEECRKEHGKHDPGPRADEICNHVIRAYHEVFDLGEDIDWTTGSNHSQAFHGLHFWGWSHTLWTAYVRTGNEKYAAGFDELFASWYAQRDKISAAVPSGAIIWYELGCGGRPTRFAQCYYAMLESKSLRMETRKLLLKTLLGHANQIQAMEECGYTDRPSPANFQLTASKNLYQVGLIFPMFRDAAKWRETGAARLLEHAYWDFSKEGGHNERCFGYGHISMKAVRQLLLSAEDDPRPSPLLKELRKKVLDMQLWFLEYVAPDGVFTGVNDSHFARIPSVLVDLAEFANDGRFLWPIRDSNRLPKGIEPRKPEFLSVHMPDGGWTFMRDGWEKESFYLQVNWGPYGGGHTHPALLDINAFAYGEPMVIEASRFGNYDNPLDSYFRSPEAHNQVTILDREFDRKNHRGENVVWRSSKKVDYFEGMHGGYEESAGKMIKRQILFVKGEYWLVVDTILNTAGQKEKDADEPKAVLNWHAPYKWKQAEMGLAAGKDGGPGVQLMVLPKSQAEFQTGYENTIEMYKSRYRACTTQPADEGTRFVTLIVPYKENPEPCNLEILSGSSSCVALRIERGNTSDRVLIATGKRKAISGGDMSTDARIAWLRERPRTVVIVDGSRVTFEKRPVLKLKSEKEIEVK